MLDFNLEYYRAFYYAAQLGSVTRAADALFLSQPAITRSIKELEKHLGCQLFTRVSRGMQLTNEGRILYEHVNNVFEELITAEKTLHNMSNFEAGILNIGATETALYHFLLPVIEAFRARYPKVFINVSGNSTLEMIQMVRNGQAEIAFGVSPFNGAQDLVVANTSIEFQDIFVAGPHLMEAEGLANRILTAKELCSLPIVALERGTSHREHVDMWFKSQGAFFKPDYSVRTSSMVLPFVQRNLAVGILPNLFAQELLNQRRIHEIKVEKPIPTQKVVIIHRELALTTVLCRNFIEFVHRQGSSDIPAV